MGIGAVPIGTDGVILGYVMYGGVLCAGPVGIDTELVGAVAGMVGIDWLLGMVKE